jgi:hypothetical protein
MIALRSHYSIDMIAAVVFAHYFFIIAERYSFIIDWYIFRIPLSKRLANDNRSTLDNSENDCNDSTNKTEFTNLSAGKFFISCKNCHHPVSNYMINEQSVQQTINFNQKDDNDNDDENVNVNSKSKKKESTEDTNSEGRAY